MNKENIISYGSFLSIACTVILGSLLYFEASFNHLIIKSFFFFGITSVVLSALYILYSFCSSCSVKMQNLIFYIGIAVIIAAILVFYGLFGLSKYWNIILGLALLHLLLIELQVLGWTAKKQGIGTKITFLLALVSNLFLAFVFIFKISLITIKPFLIAASVISILSLVFGLMFYQAKVASNKESAINN